MVATAPMPAIRTLNIVKELLIEAPIDVTFESVLAEMGPEGQMPTGEAYPLTLEAWPGGRWFRDLGNSTGHLWGHVQVIKPPKLIEIVGPMFMSYAVASHLQYRLVEQDNGTLLKLTHTAIGMMPEDLTEGVHTGWGFKMGRIRELAQKRAGK
jgi:hypothetical protein